MPTHLEFLNSPVDMKFPGCVDKPTGHAVAQSFVLQFTHCIGSFTFNLKKPNLLIHLLKFPSFIIPNAQIYPFIGWTMGIGAGGGLAPYLIVPMLLTYFISGMLSLLFGARQLCSVFCTAPLMYQGTFYDSMKKFNRTSPTARYISREGAKPPPAPIPIVHPMNG